MMIPIFILIAIMCSGMTAAKKNEFIPDYCSPKNTATINGIFSVLIFFSHTLSYINISGPLDDPYLILRRFLGQLVVVSYLFFSGYGIMESYKKKGRAYIKEMPYHRLFKTWLHFAFAMAMYAAVYLGFMKREKAWWEVALAFIGYDTLGNSNWYMFVTFVMYIIIFVSFILFKKAKVIPVGITCVLTAVFMLWMMRVDLTDPFHNLMGPQWYNTIACFPAGMVFSLIKPTFDKIVMKNDLTWYAVFTIVFMGFMYFYRIRYESVSYHALFAVMFAGMLVVLMMKVNIRSTILDWFGEHIFSFFILQRIPMLILRELDLHINQIFYVIVSFIATIFLSVIFDEVMAKLDSVIFKKKTKKKELAAK